MAKSKAPMSVEKKQLRWIKRHRVGIGSFVRIIRVPSDDELKGFPDFDMNKIRQFRGPSCNEIEDLHWTIELEW